MSFSYPAETKELNDEARELVGGAFVHLPDGITHYEIAGNESGAAVVLVHGFSVPYFIFDPTFNFLSQSGFRVLRYDLFGRGFSDRPHTRYNIDFFVKQLADLLDSLRFPPPINLIGLSMGGPIGAAFTTRYPERVKTITLIDPAGARSIAVTPTFLFMKMPFVAESVLGVVGSAPLIRSNAKDFFDPKLVKHFEEQYKVQMQYKGFLRAILSTIRNGMLDSFAEVYAAVGRMDKPVLLLWGRNDATVPFEHSKVLRAALPTVEFHVIENCGHIPHYEKPDEFNPILLDFLRK